jgi:mannose-6-phosphate isomerase
VTLLPIGNEPMRYDWGSAALLSDLLGIPETEYPIAEQWFGTHPAAPAKVLDAQNGTLSERFGSLGYLVKFLAAAQPLSIQAHPTKDHAAKQFAAQHKSYSDANHKPELIVAITEFRALCGFREPVELTEDLTALAGASEALLELKIQFESAGFEAAMRWIFESDDSAVLQLVANAPVLGRKRARLIEQLFELHGADKGILVSVLMNFVTLDPNEALYLPAGNIHAYLSGLGVEVMASSDNVLRGGLTKKPIDVRELLKVLDYRSLGEPKIKVRQLAKGLWEYPTSAEDFSVYRVEPSASTLLMDLELPDSAIAVCTQGEITLSTSQEETLTIKRGEAAFLADSRLFSVTGSGTGFLALG